MAVFHVFLLVLVIGIVHHSHGRTYESESITINGSTDTSPVKAPFYCPPRDSLPSDSRSRQNYDYFSLILQWPTSFCNTGCDACTSLIPNHFIVHGLWPQLNYGNTVDCNGDNRLPYDQLGLTELNYMIKYWPNLKVPPNNIISLSWFQHRWDYEYQKHGSCFYPFRFHLRPLYYPQETVEMARQIGNVTDMLFRGGILPDNKLHPLSEFKKAVCSKFNVMPNVRYNYARGSRTRQLYEIEFCFNRRRALINCGYSNCENSEVQPNPLVQFPRPLIVS